MRVLRFHAEEDVDVDVMAETSGKRTTGHLAAVHVVTEDEAAAGVFSVDDVVLPLPGSMISYPEHSSAQVPLASALPCSALYL